MSIVNTSFDAAATFGGAALDGLTYTKVTTASAFTVKYAVGTE